MEEQPNKKWEKGGDKIAVAFVKDVLQLCCVLQDIEPPESSVILTEEHRSLGTNSTRTIHKSSQEPRCVMLTPEKTKVHR